MSAVVPWSFKVESMGRAVGALHVWEPRDTGLRSLCGLSWASATQRPVEAVLASVERLGCQLCARKVDR